MFLGKQKFNIQKANRAKRDAQLKSKRDQRWLFTSMSQSTPRKSHGEETSFESISDIEGAYRDGQQQISSDSSPPTSSNEGAETDHDTADAQQQREKPKPKSIMVKTPKLRPSQLQREQSVNTSWGEHVHGSNKRQREIQNMLSLWAAQKRAKETEQEVQSESAASDTTVINNETQNSNDNDDDVADQ